MGTQDRIEIRHLFKSFGGKQVLRDFSFSFPKGETTCILGGSGAGKTTLLHILLGLLPPDRGEILGLAQCRFSAVFQEDRLCMDLTASANIRLVNEALTRPRAAQMLAALGLSDDPIPVRQFSGGMRRRVAILRALGAEYDLLILDEAFRGLDPETLRRSRRYLKEQTAGKTVLCVTHQPEDVAELSHRPPLILS